MRKIKWLWVAVLIFTSQMFGQVTQAEKDMMAQKSPGMVAHHLKVDAIAFPDDLRDFYLGGYHLGMTYDEFVKVQNESQIEYAPVLSAVSGINIDEVVYMVVVFVGGMPEAVACYLSFLEGQLVSIQMMSSTWDSYRVKSGSLFPKDINERFTQKEVTEQHTLWVDKKRGNVTLEMKWPDGETLTIFDNKVLVANTWKFINRAKEQPSN